MRGLILLLLLPAWAAAQTDTTATDTTGGALPVYIVKEKPKRAQKKLTLKGVTIEGDVVSILMDAPYTGVLEFTLRDIEEETIYFNQYTCSIGANRIRLKLAAFDKTGPGTYTYTIRYKDEDYTDRLVIPAAEK